MPAGRLVCDPVAIESRGPLRLLLVPSRGSLERPPKGAGARAAGFGRSLWWLPGPARPPLSVALLPLARPPTCALAP